MRHTRTSKQPPSERVKPKKVQDYIKFGMRLAQKSTINNCIRGLDKFTYKSDSFFYFNF